MEKLRKKQVFLCLPLVHTYISPRSLATLGPGVSVWWDAADPPPSQPLYTACSQGKAGLLLPLQEPAQRPTGTGSTGKPQAQPCGRPHSETCSCQVLQLEYRGSRLFLSYCHNFLKIILTKTFLFGKKFVKKMILCGSQKSFRPKE